MAEQIKLTHAEVVTFFNSQDHVKEFKNEKGTTLMFKIRTRVNDKSEKSPFVFRTCKYWSSEDQQITKVKDWLKVGSVLEVNGETNQDFNKESGKRWEYLQARNILPITIAGEAKASSRDDDLPF